MTLDDAIEHSLRLRGVVPDAAPLSGKRCDLARVTADVLAVLAQDLELVGHLLGGPESVPHVGVSGSRAKRALLAAAADHDREPRLYRPHEHLGVDELVV